MKHFLTFALITIIKISSFTQIFTVTQSFDSGDPNIEGTLSWAIEQVNAQPISASKTIIFDVDYVNMHTLNLPTIFTSNLTIDGSLPGNSNVNITACWVGKPLRAINYGFIFNGVPIDGTPYYYENIVVTDINFNGIQGALSFNFINNFKVENCSFYRCDIGNIDYYRCIDLFGCSLGLIRYNEIMGVDCSGNLEIVPGSSGIHSWISQDVTIVENLITGFDNAIHLLSSNDFEITLNRDCKQVAGNEICGGNFNFLNLSSSINIRFGGMGVRNSCYSSIVTDDLSSINCRENVLSEIVSFIDIDFKVDYLTETKAGGTATPGDTIYLYFNPNLLFIPWSVCHFYSLGYVGKTIVDSDGNWCLGYNFDFPVNSDAIFKFYTVIPDGPGGYGHTSSFSDPYHIQQVEILSQFLPQETKLCGQTCMEAQFEDLNSNLVNVDCNDITWFLPGGQTATGCSACINTSGFYSIQTVYQCESYTFGPFYVEVNDYNFNTLPTNATCAAANGKINVQISGNDNHLYQYILNKDGTQIAIFGPTSNKSHLFENLNVGSYKVIVKNISTNCSKEQNVSIQTTTDIEINISGTSTTCGADNGSASVMITLGTSPFTIEWSNGSKDVTTITNLKPDTYYVTVTDANGCSKINSIFIEDSQSPNISYNKIDPECGSNNGTISINVTGGTGGYNYQWNNGSNSGVITNLTAGEYQVTVSDQLNCTATENIKLIWEGEIKADLEILNTTCGEKNGKIFINISSLNSPFTYSVKNANIDYTNVSGEKTLEISGLESGTYMISIKDTTTCTFNQTVTILPSEQLLIEIDTNNFSCGGDDGIIILYPLTGESPYQFLLNNEPSSDGIYSNLSPNNFSVRVIDKNGCLVEMDIEVDVDINFKAVNDYFESTFLSNTLFINPKLNDLDNGDITYIKLLDNTVHNLNGEDIGSLFMQDSLKGILEYVFHGRMNSLLDTYELHYPDNEIKFKYLLCSESCPGRCDTAIVTIRNNFQCEDLLNYNFMNIITPNGDNYNDVLVIPEFPQCDINKTVMRVYNRWGEAVYESDQYSNAWDGRNNAGIPLPNGTYYYVLYFEKINGDKKFIKNFVEIVGRNN